MDMVRKIQVISVVLLSVLLAAAAVQAQTPGGDHERPPLKWLQPPDVHPTGMDVNVTLPKVLADDFLCTETGPITGIRIWASWLYDNLPPRGPGAVGFGIGIFSDIPATDQPPGFGFSRPGELLWSDFFAPGEFKAELFKNVCAEGWYDPCDTYIFPADHQIYQYTFNIDPEEAFLQEGTSEEPIVYWLGVTAMTPNLREYQIGWKTSRCHWNDDAVWATIPIGALTPRDGSLDLDGIGLPDLPADQLQWLEMRYPQGHPWAGRSIDLSFALVPEPATVVVLIMGLIPALLTRFRRPS